MSGYFCHFRFLAHFAGFTTFCIAKVNAAFVIVPNIPHYQILEKINSLSAGIIIWTCRVEWLVYNLSLAYYVNYENMTGKVFLFYVVFVLLESAFLCSRCSFLHSEFWGLPALVSDSIFCGKKNDCLWYIKAGRTVFTGKLVLQLENFKKPNLLPKW